MPDPLGGFASPWPLLAAIVLGYLLGSIPFGLVLTRLAGLGDIRKIGSGNIGATNVLRTGSRVAALITLAGDAGKGWIAVLVAARLGVGEAMVALAGFAAFLGHVFPVWLGFRGGKGVATLVGAFAGLDPWLLLPMFATWLAVVMVSGFVGLASIVAALALPVYLLIRDGAAMSAELAFATGCAALVLFTHRGNVRRMRSGSEPRSRRLWLFGRGGA